MATLKRERVPLTGRQNSARPYTSAAALTGRQNSARPSTSAAVNAHQSSSSARGHDGGGRGDTPSAPSTSRTETSELSTAEVLRRMREKSDIQRNAIDQSEIDALGPYNAFSRPLRSKTMPLRSVLLDAAVNNFPPSRTRTELMQKIKLTSAPHPSYDLDKDGYVSHEDYRLAKRFDFDGNGVLDPEERAGTVLIYSYYCYFLLILILSNFYN